jgi:CheY-like chemotaxis protein
MFKGPIVIVDDDSDDQSLIVNAVKKVERHISTRVFSSGEEVLDFLSDGSESPFLILCDIAMPKMDGITLREKIESNEVLKKKAIPFVYITGSASTADVLKAYELSVQGFFTKPNSVEGWEKLIVMILNYWDDCIHPNSLSKTDK